MSLERALHEALGGLERLEELRTSLAAVVGARGSASIRPEGPIAATFAECDLAELRFERPLALEELRVLVRAFKESAGARERGRALRRAIEDWELPVLALAADEVAALRPVEVDDAVAARLAYARLLALLATFEDHLGEPELARYFWGRLVRAAQCLQALATRARSHVLAVASIRDVDDPARHHAVNTGILSLVLGDFIGLPRRQLAPLGLAGLLHAIGRSTGPGEREAYRSVAALLGVGPITELRALCAVVAFECGVPGPAHPFARIVAVAAAHDAGEALDVGTHDAALVAALRGLLG